MCSSSLEARFDLYWRGLHPELPDPVSEFQSFAHRRFRFDRCWPEHHVAVELQGGTWAEGKRRGHTRGSMYEKDCEKLALAMADGWRVFYLTTTMLDGDPARWLGLIAKALTATPAIGGE